MIYEIEIKGYGYFDVKKDLMHRGQNPRLKLNTECRFKTVSFDSYEDFIYPLFQKGYDYQGNEILIKITKEI